MTWSDFLHSQLYYHVIKHIRPTAKLMNSSHAPVTISILAGPLCVSAPLYVKCVCTKAPHPLAENHQQDK